MTIVEKLQQIEPNVRRTMNGYNADIIKEAIKEIQKLENQISQTEQRTYEVTIPGNLDSDPVQEVDIEKEVNQLGTKTGRFNSKTPNLSAGSLYHESLEMETE